MGYTIDIDTGGTFTDGFFVLGDRVETVKVPTTPHDLTVCFLECIRAGAERFGVPVPDLLYESDIIRFSNTIGTNTIIQRDGSKIGLIMTAGRETLAPSRQDNGNPSLVLEDMVAGVREKVSPNGHVLQSPDESEARSLAQGLIDRGARCLVVAFSNSEFNPANERLVRQIIKKVYPGDYLGSVPVFLCSDISRRSGEAERIHAAVLNAYIHAKLARVLYKAGEDLRQRLYCKRLFIVHNNGSVARVAKTRAIHTYNSGPAAGLLGVRLLGRLYGEENLISADMGGTSFDLGYVHQGEPSYSLQPDVEGYPVNIPMLSIRPIGAGGGSIAQVENGKLRVGPQSAGALPGPACFGFGGTQPTVTDADLVLGILDPGFFLGGSMALNPEKARSVLKDNVANPLGISVEEAALAIKRTIDQTMGMELKQLKENTWPEFNPPLVVYGGAGPAHCCDIAQVAGIQKIIITPYSAVFSAFSSSSMDVGHVYYRRVDLPLDGPALQDNLSQAVAEMEKEAMRDMRGEGFSSDDFTSGLELFFQIEEHGKEVKVAADPDMVNNLDQMAAIGREAAPGLAKNPQAQTPSMMLTMVSLVVRAPIPHYQIAKMPLAPGDVHEAQKGTRPLYVSDAKSPRDIDAYDRSRLGPGHRIRGPALVDSHQTTLLIPAGWDFTVDLYNNAVLQQGSLS